MEIILLFFVLIALILALTLASGLRHGAPYVPSSKASIRSMLDMAGVKPGELVTDLGSGDGRILIVAATEYGARGLGIEITWFYYFWSKIKIKMLGLSNAIRVKRTDIYASDISESDVIIMFLLQDTNQLLKDKLKTELKPGTRIVSHYFTMDGWEPEQQDDRYHIYLYRV